MLKNRRYTRPGIILLLALLLVILLGIPGCGPKPSGNNRENQDDQVGRIASNPLTVLTAVEGNVMVQISGETEWRKGEVGMNLGINDRIKTEANSHAKLTFFEGSIIELKEETDIALLELGSLNGVNNIRIKQELGQTVNRVKKLADPASRYEVETVAAIAGVRGTTFFIIVTQDGTTIVGNVDGLVSVIAQGIEISIPQGMQSTVILGQPPGQPQLITLSPITISPSTTAAVSSPTISADIRTAKIGVSQDADRNEVYLGDIVTFTSIVTNTGDIPLSNILVNSGVSDAVYYSGDKNSNNLLDVGEKWTFRIEYTTKEIDVGLLVNTVNAYGTGEENRNAKGSAEATVSVLKIIVEITSLEESQTVGRNVTVAGSVNDPSITQAIILVNSNPTSISVVNGAFSVDVALVDGNNIITVTVSKPGGVSASDTVELEPIP